MDGKRVCQFGLPNGVKDVMRRSPSEEAYNALLALQKELEDLERKY